MSASDWIKIRKCLFTHPKVSWMADRCGMSRQQMVGWLAQIWAWADDHCADGTIDGMGLKNVQDVTLAPDKVLAAMRHVGWIVVENDAISFPDFDEHMSESAKKRATDSARKRKERREKPQSERVRKNSDKSRTRGDKRRRDKNKGNTPYSPPLKESEIKSELDRITDPQLRNAVQDWLVYKGERRQFPKRQGLKILVSRVLKLAAQGRDVADLMERASSSGWAGWEHEDKTKPAQKPLPRI